MSNTSNPTVIDVKATDIPLSDVGMNIDEKKDGTSSGKRVGSFVLAVALPVAVGLASSFVTRGNMNVFDEIAKPPLTPPAIVFPIAWTVLYILMGMASYFAAKNCKGALQQLVVLFPYAVQLIFNFFWSLLFFNGQAYGWAFICLLLMWAAILTTMASFYKVSKLAMGLMIPLLVWVSFAGYLNAGVFLLQG